MLSAPFECYASTSLQNGFPQRNEALEAEIADYVNNLPEVKWEGHTGQLEDVLTALEEDRPVAIAGEDGRNTIELICAIYKSGSEGSSVTLPIKKDDPFYTVAGIMASVPHFYKKTNSVGSLDGDITLGSSYQK